MRMGLCVLGVLALLGFAGCASGVATGAKRIVQPCPLKHGTWEPMPAFSDEFDGTQLDLGKWHRNNPGWKGRNRCPHEYRVGVLYAFSGDIRRRPTTGPGLGRCPIPTRAE